MRCRVSPMSRVSRGGGNAQQGPIVCSNPHRPISQSEPAATLDLQRFPRLIGMWVNVIEARIHTKDPRPLNISYHPFHKIKGHSRGRSVQSVGCSVNPIHEDATVTV